MAQTHPSTETGPEYHPFPTETAPQAGFPVRIRQKISENLVIRRPLPEINGAMGDLGTFIPIIIAVTLVNGLDLSITLIFTGLYNIITGVFFGVPMPVQPMKSIASVAVSTGKSFTVGEIMAAGIFTASTLFLLGITGLMRLAYALIPLPVVRGVQLSQGLAFALTAVKYVRNKQNFSTGKSTGTRPWLGLDGLVLALVSLCFIVIVNGAGDEDSDLDDESGALPTTITNPNPNPNNSSHDNNTTITATGSSTNISDNCSTNRRIFPIHWFRFNKNKSSSGGPSGVHTVMRRQPEFMRKLSGIPSAMIVFLMGIVIAIIRDPSIIKHLKFGPSSLSIVHITKKEWRDGIVKAAIPQIPLSVLNSVIAVCKLSSDLFPGKDFSATSVSVSVGLMNLVGCWFGAMPCCHGAGGLAGQYKFGARSGASVALLGLAKLVLGVVLGNSFVMILNEFPVGLLGVLLLFAGIELAMACRDMGSKEESFVMLVVTSVSMVGSSAALGFVCGIVVYLLLRLRDLRCFSRSSVDEPLTQS
ncbi:hypothetical protein AMTRI_Chr06g177510 [Amborella trichopoda]|uniref:SLC26A/SulP transporter domain-containing protein n=1 Tax=Amborella trichopoda TaxID=13333 RepID=W1PZ30_AMBTC|nr:molybdate transporter 1 [Amborella trichopoda]ERN13623.1 hypothetical protein AMTR_s00049p00084210 [Amborella trichopoda]|eukprot:XP_006852156.1 molybdate transporter 1 [Amborella trichopoda]